MESREKDGMDAEAPTPEAPSTESSSTTSPDPTTSTPLGDGVTFEDARQEQGDPVGSSIIDRRHSAADAGARDQLDAATPSVEQQVEEAIFPKRVMADDELKLASLQYAEGNLDVAKEAYDFIVAGRTRPEVIPARRIPDDVLLQNAFGAVKGNLDAFKLASDWLLD